MDDSLISSSLLAVAVVFPILSTAATGLRFYAHRLSNQKVMADDWMILVTVIVCWGTSAMTFWTADKAGVNNLKISPTDAIYYFAATQWIGGGMLLGTSLATVKISVLLFYRRIFVTPAFRICAWTMIALCAIWGTSTVVCQILVTNPITGVLHPNNVHNRYDASAFYISVAAVSFGLDVLILLFPLPVLRTLQMPLRRKLAIMGVFWLGGLVIVAGIARLYYIYQGIHQTIAAEQKDNGTSIDPYKTTRKFFIWALIEPNASAIAACLPTMAPLRHSKLGDAFASSFKLLASWGSFGSSNSGGKKSDRQDFHRFDHGGADSSSANLYKDSESQGQIHQVTTVDVEMTPLPPSQNSSAYRARGFD